MWATFPDKDGITMMVSPMRNQYPIRLLLVGHGSQVNAEPGVGDRGCLDLFWGAFTAVPWGCCRRFGHWSDLGRNPSHESGFNFF